MRLATWNVNSVRTRLVRLLAWLDEHRPDVLCLQETKVVDDDFPSAQLEAAGWSVAAYGQPTYNGVALVSREPAADPERGFTGDGEEARFIAGTFAGVRVASAYVPNGREVGSDKYSRKLAWIERLGEWLDARPDGERLALCGDFNIAADYRDVCDPERWEGTVLWNDEMRAAFGALEERGLVDAFRQTTDAGGLYSWWDYRRLAFPKNQGLRIDYVMVTENLAGAITSAFIDRDQRKKSACPDGTAPSDHVPVVVDLDLGGRK